MSKIFGLKDLKDTKSKTPSKRDNDYLLALQLQIQLANDDEEDSPKSANKSSQLLVSPRSAIKSDPIGDPQWDLIDPCPDIRALFQEFDKKYFWNTLGSCIVEWSKRMTICAGIFYLRGGGTIRLSETLLKFRPRKDLVETLLHEMIHAYLYLTRNFRDRDGHGDEFKSHMNRINRLASTNITIYHSFHDEVNHARQHVWRCNGECRTEKPFFGYVKRSMNRAPSKNDRWWPLHQSKCNGTFEKVAEPEAFREKQLKAVKKLDLTVVDKKKPQPDPAASSLAKIDSFFVKHESGKKRKSDELEEDVVVLEGTQSKPIVLDEFDKALKESAKKVQCPICMESFYRDLIDPHVNGHFS